MVTARAFECPSVSGAEGNETTDDNRGETETPASFNSNENFMRLAMDDHAEADKKESERHNERPPTLVGHVNAVIAGSDSLHLLLVGTVFVFPELVPGVDDGRVGKIIFFWRVRGGPLERARVPRVAARGFTLLHRIDELDDKDENPETENESANRGPPVRFGPAHFRLIGMGAAGLTRHP